MKENYFSKNLAMLRKQNNLTTGNIAQSLKIPEDAILGWELGMIEPETKDILKIAKFFKVEATDLVNTNLSKFKGGNNGKMGVKAIVFQSVIILLSVFTIISFAFDCFAVDLYGLNVSFTFFDILIPEKFIIETLFAWFILLFVIFNIVNGIIKFSSTRARTGRYAHVSNVLMYTFNASALIFWIIVLILNKDLKFKFCAIWLLIAFVAIIACIICANVTRKNVDKVIKNHKVDSNKIKLILFYILAALALICLLYSASSIIFQGYKYCTYEDMGYGDYHTVKIFESAAIIWLIPFIGLIVTTILLMIKKFRSNNGKKKALSIVGIVLSAIMIPIHYLCELFVENQVDNIVYGIGVFEKIGFVDMAVAALFVSLALFLSAYIVMLCVKNNKTKTKKSR